LRLLRTSSQQATPRRSSRFRGAFATSGADPWPSQFSWADVLGEVMLNLCMVAAGAIIWWTPFQVGVASDRVSRWCYIDPCLALLTAVYLIWATRPTIRENLMQLLMACPRNINLSALHRGLANVEGVESLYDLHVWQIGRSRVCTAHLIASDVQRCQQILRDCSFVAQQEHRLDKITFQVEIPGGVDSSAGL